MGLVAFALVLTMGTWFAASAVAPALREEWSLSSGGATLLTTSVQVGFVAGALVSAALTLSDVVDATRLLAASAVAAAASTAALAWWADGLVTGVALRFVTGMALAGVYPVGMKLASSWYVRGRGLALAVLIAALTLGSAMPQLIGGALSSAWRQSLYAAAVLCLVGAALAVGLVRVGPYVTRAARFDPAYLSRLVRIRGARLANVGYLGHMWELYAVWVWLPFFLSAGLDERGLDWPAGAVASTSFLIIGGCGVAGCLAAGWAGERFGRARVAAWAMLASGSCCLISALLFGASPWLTIPVMAAWGAAVIADSAMFSACLSSVVDREHVGTALTIQTAAGFTLTVVTIQGLPLVVDAAGWPVAVALLGVGPLLGSVAMLRLDRILPASAQQFVVPKEQT